MEERRCIPFLCQTFSHFDFFRRFIRNSFTFEIDRMGQGRRLIEEVSMEQILRGFLGTFSYSEFDDGRFKR